MSSLKYVVVLYPRIKHVLRVYFLKPFHKVLIRKLLLKTWQHSQKISVLESPRISLFNKVAGLKETSAKVLSYDYSKIFKNTYFEENL